MKIFKIKSLLIFVFVFAFVFFPVLGNVPKASATPAGFTAQPYYVNYNDANYYMRMVNGAQGSSFFIGDDDVITGPIYITKENTHLSILDGSKDLYLVLVSITNNSRSFAKITFFTDNTEEEINTKILAGKAALPEFFDVILDFYSSKPIWIHHGSGYDYTYDASALPEGATIANSGYVSSDLEITYDGIDYNFNVTDLSSLDKGIHVLANSENSINEITFLVKDESYPNMILGVDSTKNFDLVLVDEISNKGLDYTSWIVPSGFELESLNSIFEGKIVCRESDVFVSNGADQDYTFKLLDTWTGCDKTKVVLGNTNPTFIYETFPLTLTTLTPEPEPVPKTEHHHTTSGSSVSSRYNNLLVTGNTKAAEELKNKFPNAINPTTLIPEVKFTFTKNLKQGMTDEEVKELQKFLNTHGFPISLTGTGSVGNETNYFGSLTKKALILFQKANNITPAIGYFGPITRALVNGMK